MVTNSNAVIYVRSSMYGRLSADAREQALYRVIFGEEIVLKSYPSGGSGADTVPGEM